MRETHKDRPLVKLKGNPALEGRIVDFIPIHHGIDAVLSGTLHVVEAGAAFHVGVVYSPPSGGAPIVYWLDQSEADALVG